MDKAKEYYEKNAKSLAYIAKHSKDICGQTLSLDVLKKASADQNWIKGRQMVSTEKSKLLSDLLFDKMTEEDLSAKDLAALVSSWLNVQKNSGVELDREHLTDDMAKDMIRKALSES